MGEVSVYEDLPVLGTADAALHTCVNLISRATGQPEALLSYWLDLYYQLRLRLEHPSKTAESAAPPHPQKEPATEAKIPGAAAAAAYKRDVLNRLRTARELGVTVPTIVKMAEGNITEDQVRNILDARPTPVAVYRVLAAALDRMQLAQVKEEQHG